MTDTFIKYGRPTNVIGGNGPGSAYMTVVDDSGRWPYSASIVIGAAPINACASYFNKETLTELIDILMDVRDAMKVEGEENV